MMPSAAKLYFNHAHIADIDDIQYETPFFIGRHHFFDMQFADLLVRISMFAQSEYWEADELDEDERDRKLDELQQQLALSDEDLAVYFYVASDKWQIVLVPQNERFNGLPILDKQFIEWR